MRTRALVAARSCVVIWYLVALLQWPWFVFRLRFGTLVLSRRVHAPCAPQVGRGLTGSAQARCARWSTLQSVGVSGGASGADPAFKGTGGNSGARLSCKSVPGWTQVGCVCVST